jgi:apolipoprotein N-acyltransferase
VDELEQQVKVSKMLGMAFVLSITGIFGVGSLIALIVGWKAARIIQASKGRISGGVMAWWCILAGTLGTLILPPLTIVAILKQLK